MWQHGDHFLGKQYVGERYLNGRLYKIKANYLKTSGWTYSSFKQKSKSKIKQGKLLWQFSDNTAR